MPDEDPDELPWTEEQWEAHLKRSEVRAARFGELLETLIDDPDRERKIDQEMGWNLFDDDDDDGPGAWDQAVEGALDGEEDGDGDDVASAAAGDADADGDSDDDADADADWDPEEDERQLNAIEAYARSMAVSERVQTLLDPHLKSTTDTDDDEEVGQAFINAHIAVAKIAGGHGMGYDDEVLCGNIVYNKIALAANQRCEQALLTLKARGFLPAGPVDDVVAEVREAGRAIERRIAELRQRVWWDKGPGRRP